MHFRFLFRKKNKRVGRLAHHLVRSKTVAGHPPARKKGKPLKVSRSGEHTPSSHGHSVPSSSPTQAIRRGTSSRTSEEAAGGGGAAPSHRLTTSHPLSRKKMLTIDPSIFRHLHSQYQKKTAACGKICLIMFPQRIRFGVTKISTPLCKKSRA